MANNTFTKTNGSFSRKLSPELIEKYFATQSKEANPLSPLEFQAQQAGQGANLTPGNIAPNITNPTPETSNYADTFNNVMMSLLKKAQGVDTTELLKRKRALERASLGRASETTPEELRTLSPSQQSAIRSADVKALSGEIDFNAYELAKAEQQIDNFYRAFEATSKLGAGFADKIPLPDKVKESFVTALQSRPVEDWSTILAGLPDKQKSEVLAEVDYSQIKEKSKDESFTLGKDQTRFDEKGNVIARGVSEAGAEVGATSEVLDNYSLVNEILNTENLSLVTGLSRFSPTAYLPGAGLIKNKIAQLTNILSLNNRQKLKGSGAISDFEAKMLAQASTALGVNLSDSDFKKELKKIKGVFATAVGLEADVSITDPDTGRTKQGSLNREDIDSAISQGYIIEYK